MSSKTWVRLSLDSLREVGCTKSAAVVLALIADRATDAADRSAIIDQRELVELSGCGRRTVIRAVQQLEALELVRVQRTPGQGSRYALTERVQLPSKKRSTPRQAAAAAKRRKADELTAKLAAYEAAANRFKEDERE